MRLRTSTLVTVIVSVACVPAAIAVGQQADSVGIGSKDFYPSPKRPIGFRGNGNGWYRGATPVSQWWEYTPTQVKRDYKDKRGRSRRTECWQLSEPSTRNIVWKTEMPSFANTQPVVVGDRVLCYGEPDRLICVDAHSGKVLWTTIVNPWKAAGVETETADTCREMGQIYHALLNFADLQFHFGTCGRYLKPDDYLPMLQTYLAKDLPRMVARLKELDPDGGWDKPAEQDIAAYRAYQKEPFTDSKKCWKYGKKVNRLAKHIDRRLREISDKDIPLDMPWGNMVGWCMSTPVSDGEFVYVQMGQGQTACLDLKGRIVWSRWFKQGKVSTHHVLSPLLADGVLVDMHGGNTLRGLDARTGKTVWEAPTAREQKSKRGGYYIASHKLLDLDGEKYIVTSQCNLLRARDGQPVGEIDYGPAYGGGAPIAGWGDIVLKCACGDGWSEPFRAFRLTHDEAGKVVARKMWEASKGSYNARIMTPEATFLCGRDTAIVDTKSGKVLHKGRHFGGDFRILAGNTMIWVDGGNRNRLNSNWSHRRWDGKVATAFTTCDVSEPGSPKTLSSRNVLGGSNIPRYPELEKYLASVWGEEEYYNAKGGKPAHFAHMDSYFSAQGNRLFIRTASHLYCIGDPQEKYDWAPSSRPERITRSLEK